MGSRGISEEMPVSRGRSPSARAFIPIFPVSNHGIRGHVQTIFGKINVIMTLRGGVACDANFFVCALLSFCQLFLQDFAAIMPII